MKMALRATVSCFLAPYQISITDLTVARLVGLGELALLIGRISPFAIDTKNSQTSLVPVPMIEPRSSIVA